MPVSEPWLLVYVQRGFLHIKAESLLSSCSLPSLHLIIFFHKFFHKTITNSLPCQTSPHLSTTLEGGCFPPQRFAAPLIDT
ncbi:hypothetical protein DRJ00_00020 [Candidatus Aerophobetes bacterium]|uniref:Uncharacterized protein n=1 Tax=Aerophobetes bacterium TaxID=2030807 RepID=A0A497E694_UNCAE|nr:MAG: hypothetical protein DRJ00_00020 [Candidatus Aerophobetes bacterium]